MVSSRSASLSNLVISISILAILLSSSPVAGKYCTCNKDAIVTSEAKSEPEACSDAASKCRQDGDCKDGEECEKPLQCGSIKIRSTFLRSPPNTTVECTVKCTGGNEKCVKSGDGQGDPHLTGFDGSHYDFHGEHGRHYTLLGRSKGDLLVTRMRSSGKVSPRTLVESTFFNGFGLQVGNCSDRLSLSLVADNENPGQWRSRMMVNGQEIVRSQNFGCADVEMGSRSRTVTITTAEGRYSFTAKLRPRQTMKRHIDVNVKMLRAPQKSDVYFGVLGFTINKVIGHGVHPDLDVATRESIDLEKSLRGMFQVDSLFPARSTESIGLQNVARVITEDVHLAIPPMLSADVISTNDELD